MDVNGCLMRLAKSLEERGVPHPLELKMTPTELMSFPADDGLRATGRSPLDMACTTLAATLESEGVPDPLHQPFTLGMLWLDLCRLAGEIPPTMVEAVLDMPAAWPQSGESDGPVRVHPYVAGLAHSATVPKKGGEGW